MNNCEQITKFCLTYFYINIRVWINIAFDNCLRKRFKQFKKLTCCEANLRESVFRWSIFQTLCERRAIGSSASYDAHVQIQQMYVFHGFLSETINNKACCPFSNFPNFWEIQGLDGNVLFIKTIIVSLKIPL